MKIKIFKPRQTYYLNRYKEKYIHNTNMNIRYDDYFGQYKKSRKSSKKLNNKITSKNRCKINHIKGFNTYDDHMKGLRYKKPIQIRKYKLSKTVFCREFCNKCYSYGTNWDKRCSINNDKPIHQVINNCNEYNYYKNNFIRWLKGINKDSVNINRIININRFMPDDINRKNNIERLKDIFLERELIEY